MLQCGLNDFHLADSYTSFFGVPIGVCFTQAYRSESWSIPKNILYVALLLIGWELVDGFLAKKFDWVDSFREIGNPEINASEENIIGYDRQEQGTEVSEWMWGGTDLVMIDRHFEVADTDYETIETRQIQERALVGYWEWVDDGEKPSTIHLTLDLQHEAMTLYVNECTIYGSTAAFDLECDYENGILTLKASSV